MESPLNFVPLDLNKVKLVLISDAWFENAWDLRSQLGYIIALVDIKGQTNIVHYV